VARPTKEIEVKRRELEGYLGSLGAAICLIDLATTRVGSAVQVAGHAPLLQPAVDDLSQARGLVRSAQSMIKRSCPSVFGEGKL